MIAVPMTVDTERGRRVLRLAGPAAATLLADPLLGLVDTAVAGRLGAVELGALGLAVAVLGTVSWVFNFLVYGTTAAVARAVGAGDRRAAGRHVAHAGMLAVGLGTLVAVGLLGTAPLLLHGLGAVPALAAAGATYLRVRAVGVPFLLLGYVAHGAFRGVADTRTPLGVVVVANLLNAVLDVVLVFGLGAGLAGVAWATVAAEIAAVLLFLRAGRRLALPVRGHPRPGRADIRRLLVVGRDLFLRTGALLAGLLAITAAAARIDAVTAAAHQVTWQVWLVVSYLVDGVAIAAQALVGSALGAGDRAEARALARGLLRGGVLAGALIGSVLWAAGGWLPRLLTDDPAVLAAVGGVWALATLSHIVNAPVFALDGVLMGAGDFPYLRTWALVGAVVAAAGAQLAVAADGGLVGLWVALEAMMLVRLTSLVVRIRGQGWLRVGPDLP